MMNNLYLTFNEQGDVTGHLLFNSESEKMFIEGKWYYGVFYENLQEVFGRYSLYRFVDGKVKRLKGQEMIDNRKRFIDEKNKQRIIHELKKNGNLRIRTIGKRVYGENEWLLKLSNAQDDIIRYLTAFNDEKYLYEIDYMKAKLLIDRKDDYVKFINEKEKGILNTPYNERLSLNHLDFSHDDYWKEIEDKYKDVF